MAQILNIKTVSIPSIGKVPLSDNPGSFSPSGITREHKKGRLPEDGGFIESSQPAMLTLNVNLISGVDIVALNRVSDENVIVRMTDGSVHMLNQASVTKPVSVENGDSQLEIVANTSERIS